MVILIPSVVIWPVRTNIDVASVSGVQQGTEGRQCDNIYTGTTQSFRKYELTLGEPRWVNMFSCLRSLFRSELRFAMSEVRTY